MRQYRYILTALVFLCSIACTAMYADASNISLNFHDPQALLEAQSSDMTGSERGSTEPSVMFQNPFPEPDSVDVPVDVVISVDIVDESGVGIDSSSVIMQLDGSAVTPEITEIQGGVHVSYAPQTLVEGTNYRVDVAACSMKAQCDSFYWSFTTLQSQREIYFANHHPAPGATGVARDTGIYFEVLSDTTQVEPSTITLWTSFDGEVTPTISPIEKGYSVYYQSNNLYPAGYQLGIEISACTVTKQCITQEYFVGISGGAIYFRNQAPQPGSMDVPVDSIISVDVLSDESEVDPQSISLILGDIPVTQSLQAIEKGYHVSAYPQQMLPEGAILQAECSAATITGDEGYVSWTFTTIQGAGGWRDHYPEPGAIEVALDTNIHVEYIEEGAQIDPSNVTLAINDTSVTPTVSQIENGVSIDYQHPNNHEYLDPGVENTVSVSLVSNGELKSTQWSFISADLPVLTNLHPPNGASDVPGDVIIEADLTDQTSGVDPTSIEMTIDNQLVSPQLTQIENGYHLAYQPSTPFSDNETVCVMVSSCDMVGNCSDATSTWVFETLMPPVYYDNLPKGNEVPLDSTVSINILDKGIGVDPETILMTINGSEVTPSLQPRSNGSYYVSFQPLDLFPAGADVDVWVSAADLHGMVSEFAWSFITTAPPYISFRSPAPGTTGVRPDTSITIEVKDKGRGVDPSSVAITVNHSSVSPTMEAIESGIRMVYQASEPYPQGSRVDVSLGVCDFAGNCIEESWTFNILDNTPETPINVYPADGAWLNYYLEEGMVKFSWTTVSGVDCYRLRTIIGDSVSWVDFAPGDYSEFMGIATVLYPVSEQTWDVLSELGGIAWDVCGIRQPGGAEITPYSEPTVVTFAPTYAVVLREPADFSVLPVSPAPIFKWDAYPGAHIYRIFLALMGDDGFIGDLVQDQVPGWLTELWLTQDYWDSFDAGFWLWTVIARSSFGEHSGYMIFHFTKSEGDSNQATRPAQDKEALIKMILMHRDFNRLLEDELGIKPRLYQGSHWGN